MYYELYVDSLFLVNFVMNLFLLLLVNQSMYRAATRLRLILGAGAGAGLYLIPFLGYGPVWLRLLSGIAGGTAGMILIAFPIRSARVFLRIAERLLLYSFLMGGTMLFLIKRVPFLRKSMGGIAGILGMGTAAFLLFSWAQEQQRGKECVCRVSLVNGLEKVSVSALIDSGNSLVEPISGKPVSIIEKDVFASLWKKEPDYYRAVPFHSIGKKRGMLKGFLLPEIHIERDGLVKVCHDVYVAVSEEQIAGVGNVRAAGRDCAILRSRQSNAKVRMILHPALLE